MLILDEAGYHFGFNDDNLKEELRSINGIPNATYIVQDGWVFVFAKLVRKVKEHRQLMPGATTAQLAQGMVSTLARATPEEAVENWGIVPVPYEVVDPTSGPLWIRHRPFNARLPGSFDGKRSIQQVLARILVGNVQPGAGSFSYRGQSLTLCDPLDLATLPERPGIAGGLEPARYSYAALGGVNFEPGFEPVSEELYKSVKDLEATWVDESARAGQFARTREPEIWARSPDLQLEKLNDPTFEVPEYFQEEFAGLRPLYPELVMLTDGSLYAMYDSYQMYCCYIQGWTAQRDDGFLFYLIGKVAGFEGEAAKRTGEMVAFSLLQQCRFDTALDFGRACSAYDSAIGGLAHRIAEAMRFLAEDKRAVDLRGHPISTLGDMYRLGRKSNTKPFTVSQDFQDFRQPGGEG